MNLNDLSLGQKIIGAAGILLIIDLLFLPWHSIDTGFGEFTRSGIESPNSLWGILALIVAILMVVAVVMSAMAADKLPQLPVPLGRALFIAGVAAFVLLLIKLVVETDFLGFGAWLGLILGAALAYGGFLMKDTGASTTGPGL